MTIQTTLGELRVDNSHTLDPSKFAGQAFDLYSVPSHETGQPEVAQAEAIGSAKRTTAPGTVLLCKINPRINRVWVVGPKNGLPQIASTEWIQFGPTDGLEPAYLAWYMRQQWVRDHLAANASGVGGSLMRVRPKILDDIPINIPPVGEQRRIVAEIDEQLSRLEAGVAALKRVQANLKRYRASVLSELCKSNCDHLPSGWARKALGELAKVVRGGSPRPAGDPRYFGGPIPWITVGPITASIGKYLTSVPEGVTEAGKDRSRYITAGTLLLTNSGATLGVPKITAIDGCINDGVAPLLDVTEPLKSYLLHFLASQTDRLRGTNQGAAQPNLNTTIIKTISVPLPPKEQMAHIVTEIERRLSVVEELETQVSADLARAERLRQSVLSSAFSS